MTYTIIDENEEQKKYNEVVEKITPQTLGLRPTTDFAEFAQQTIINDNYEKAREWVNKGAIGVMEAGANFADEFDGTYGNIAPKKEVDYAEWQKKGQKVLGKIGNVLNKIYDGEAVYQETLRQAEVQENIQKPHKNNPNYRYTPVGADRTGKVIYNELDLRKKIGFQEALADSIGQGKALPFISGWIEGESTKKFRNISERIRNNEEIRQDELDYVNHYLERKNEEYLRGYTIGGEIGKSWLPSMLAFGIEIALGGAVLSKLGLAGKGIAGGVSVGKNLLKTGKVSKDIAKGVAYTSGQLMEGGINAAVTTAVNPARLFATYQERRLNDEIKITDRGTVIFQEAKESPAKAFMKSLGQVYISYFAENMGGLIGAPVRGLAGTGAKQFAKVLENNPLLAKFVKKSSPILAKAYEKLNNLPIKGKAVDWLKSQVKFDGFLEELGEEVLEDILNLTIGTDNEERSLENYVKTIVKTPEEWAVLCGVIALQGTTLSLAGNMLGDVMKRNGTPEEKLFEVLQNSTENERLEILEDLAKMGDINIPDTALSSDLEIEKSEIEDRVFEKFTTVGEKEDIALANAKLFGQFFSKYGARNEETKKKFYEWFDKFEVRYNVTPEELKEQLKQEALYQSAMYKSPKKSFEEFYNQVQQEKNPKQKAYYTQQTKQGVNIDIFHDVVRHDEKKHSLSKEEWNDLSNSIDDNIEDKIIANKSYYRGTPLLLKVNVNGDYYGVSMEVFPNRNIITTAFKSTEKGVDTWFKKDKKKSAGTTAPNHQSGSSIAKNNNVISGQTLTDIINDVKTNFNPDTLYQSANVAGVEKNLLMTHAMKSYRLDDVIESGGLIAPSFAITKKDMEGDALNKFGDILFIRNPKKIDFQNDNIYDRDIYSPRIPQPWYDIPDGRTVDNYEYESLKRNYESNPEKFVEKWGKTFDEMFKGAKKVLNLGFTPSGNRKFVPYTNENILKEMKKQGLVNKEGFDYGLSSLLSRFSTQKKDLKSLKETAKSELGSKENSDEKYEQIKQEYEKLGEKLAPLYWDKYSFYEFQSDVFYAIAKNKKKYLKDTYNIEVPAELEKEVKEFIEKAKSLPRSYFEANPMREVDLSEFSYAIAEKGVISDKQKQALEDKGIKVIEYNHGEKESAIKNLQTKAPEVYFQSANNDNQNVVDLTDDFDKTPTLQEVKEYINEIVEKGTKFATLSPEWFIDIKGSSKKKDHVAKSSNYSKMNKSQKNRHNKYVMSLEKLLANAEYLYSKENTKPDKKPNVAMYHYFKTDVKIGDKIYQVIFDTEEYKNEISSLSANVLRSVKNLDEDTNSITDNKENHNPKTVHLYNISEKKKSNVLHQNTNENEKLIAGFTYQEVMDKLTEIWEKLCNGNLDKKTIDMLMAQQHILEDAFEVAENPNKFSNEDERHEIMLNAYYIMNNQEIPQDYIEADKVSQRSYNDYKEIHERKKEQKENEYYGYFSETQDKNIITIMSNSNSSTALHELGHLFLNGLNELAKVDENAQKQLEAVNKWLGFSGEYTIAQQEKFARSFEAYLYRGKAPNNNLRQVFENFKEWLKSVYEHVSELVAKGADISDEVTEMFDKMFGEDEYYQEKKQVTALLRKVRSLARKEKSQNNIKRKEKTLTEGQKRCKQVSYEILSVATGKDINYLKRIFETDSNKNGYAKRRENIEKLLEHVGDKITVSGGMSEHWKEFYSDTGVSYGNEEINGGYALAQQALQTIINKNYFDLSEKFDNELTERGEYFERAVDNAQRQYKVLIRSFKSGNRNVALSAIYEWLDGLDNEIKQDFEDRFIFDSAIIERDEKVNKFDKAKREILSKAMALENKYSINDNEKYQEIVKEIMKNLNFLQPSDKAKLTANILDVPSTVFLMSSIDNIMDIAKTMEDVNLRIKLSGRIHAELQDTKNVKKNGRTVGKYDYRTNKLFIELREFDRLSSEKANEIRLEAGKFANAEDNGLSKIDKLKMKFLSYKAGGRNFADIDLLKELYDEIVNIKLIGKSAKSELDLMEKISEDKDIEELINIVENKKEASLTLKGYINGIGNLESTLNAIFNKKIANKYGAELLYAETQAQSFQYEQKTKFEKEVAKIYNLPEWCWDKKILDYLGEKHTFVEFRRKYDKEGNLIKTRHINRTLTKMDIIGAYIWSKNEVLEKRLKNQFGEDTLDSMFELLSSEDEKFAQLMMSTAQSFYPLVNKTFVKKYGLNLPKVSCYFPSTPERGSEVDLYNDYSSKALGNGFTKARAQSELLPMDFHNPVTTLYSHIDGVAKFAFMSEHLDNINLRFKDTDLRRVIINKYGKGTYRTLEQILMNVTYKKEAQIYSGFNKVVDHLVTNWVSTNVAIKPIVGLKQLLSANNYAANMPYMEWQAGFLNCLAHPKETIDYMMKIPYLKARFGGSMTNEFLKQTVENSAFAASKKLKDLCGLFIKTGDIGAIVFGGKPYIDYLIEQGMSEDEAIKQFVLSTNRTQQSSAVSSLSNLQVNWGRNPFLKLFIAYKNSPLQYIRMCGDALVAVSNGDMTKQQCAKTIFQYAYVQPFLYAVATSGSLFRFLFTGDDDDLIKDLTSSIFNLNADGIPFIGDIYKYAMDKIVYKEKNMVQTTPLIGDIEKEISKLAKEDLDAGDYLKSIAYLLIQLGLGYNTNALATMGSGVGDVFTGENEQGVLKMFGYTDYRAKHIIGKK